MAEENKALVNETEVETVKESKVKAIISKGLNAVKEHPVRTTIGVVATGVLVYCGIKAFKSEALTDISNVVDFENFENAAEEIAEEIKVENF